MRRLGCHARVAAPGGRRFVVWIYWSAVAMVAVFERWQRTLRTSLHIPYAISTATFSVALFLVFLIWHLSEKYLSIHSIFTLRRELFYWAAVIATFALGTAAAT